MAYLTITRIEGDPDRLLDGYRQASEPMSGVGADHGLLVHSAAKTDDGLMIVNLWPSRDGSESAARDPRRLGVMQRLGLTPAQLHAEHFEVADYQIFR